MVCALAFFGFAPVDSTEDNEQDDTLTHMLTNLCWLIIYGCTTVTMEMNFFKDIIFVSCTIIQGHIALESSLQSHVHTQPIF